jgi:hypothetical protein
VEICAIYELFSNSLRLRALCIFALNFSPLRASALDSDL